MADKADKLISLETLFGNPDKIAVRISPDGRYISFVAPHNNVLNIWIAPVDNPGAAVRVTDDSKRGIRRYFWSYDSNHIIYLQDKDGDENWRLISADINSNKHISLSPEKNVRAEIIHVSKKHPEYILAAFNSRVPEYFDVYKINISNGQSELIYKNTGLYTSFLADDDLNIRFVEKLLPDGVNRIDQMVGEFGKGVFHGKVKHFIDVPAEDMLNTGLLHLSSDGKKLFMRNSVGRDTSALVAVDLAKDVSLATGENIELLYSSDKADISDHIYDPVSKYIQAASIEYGRAQWTILDKSIEEDFALLKKLEDGDFNILARTIKDDKWVVSFSKSDGAHKYYLYHRDKQKADFLFSSSKALEEAPLAKMYPKIIQARDGLDMVTYVTVPRWLDKGEAKVNEPLPLILYVHGGPNARDRWGFCSTSQLLANRGYAVIKVNYRGSTGFGKAFVNAGDGQWSGKMQRDLEDAVQWAVKEGIADPSRVVIMGGSYGGYATLVGMAMTPDLYVAGIDIVGPSNIETLVESMPPYWKPAIAHITKMIGVKDVTSPESMEKMRKISPLFYVDNIKKPLMVVQGANDPRVKQSESDQIVAAMKARKIPVMYLLYPDEGHGLVRPDNIISMFSYIDLFLANVLKGRSLPISEDIVKASSIQVIEGSDLDWIEEKKE